MARRAEASMLKRSLRVGRGRERDKRTGRGRKEEERGGGGELNVEGKGRDTRAQTSFLCTIRVALRPCQDESQGGVVPVERLERLISERTCLAPRGDVTLPRQAFGADVSSQGKGRRAGLHRQGPLHVQGGAGLKGQCDARSTACSSHRVEGPQIALRVPVCQSSRRSSLQERPVGQPARRPARAAGVSPPRSVADSSMQDDVPDAHV